MHQPMDMALARVLDNPDVSGWLNWTLVSLPGTAQPFGEIVFTKLLESLADFLIRKRRMREVQRDTLVQGAAELRGQAYRWAEIGCLAPTDELAASHAPSILSLFRPYILHMTMLLDLSRCWSEGYRQNIS